MATDLGLVLQAEINMSNQLAKNLENIRLKLAQPLTEFTLFPSLPIEMRAKIFEMALPDDDAIIEVVPDLSKRNSSMVMVPRYQGIIGIHPSSTVITKQPRAVALLRVCKESNMVYTMAFRTTLKIEGYTLPSGKFHPGGILCVGAGDTLIIKNFIDGGANRLTRGLQLLPTPDLTTGIKVLIIYLRPISIMGWKWILKSFRCLETIRLVTRWGNYKYPELLVACVIKGWKPNLLQAKRELLAEPGFQSLKLPDFVQCELNE